MREQSFDLEPETYIACTTLLNERVPLTLFELQG
jgi:hypothetical protein